MQITTHFACRKRSPRKGPPFRSGPEGDTVDFHQRHEQRCHPFQRPTESYSTIAQWSPPWLASLLTGELPGGMTRSSANGAAVKHATLRQARASVTMHLTKSRGLPVFAAPAR
jgi:hypothetical protein